MLNDFTGADRVYIACGYTDLRKGIDGLSAMVQSEFDLDPFTNTLFLFFGRRRDRIKALYWEQDGFSYLRIVVFALRHNHCKVLCEYRERFFEKLCRRFDFPFSTAYFPASSGLVPRFRRWRHLSQL